MSTETKSPLQIALDRFKGRIKDVPPHPLLKRAVGELEADLKKAHKPRTN